MPLLDIATAQSCFQNHILSTRSSTLWHNRFVIGNGGRLGSSFYWKSLRVVEKHGKHLNLGGIQVCRGGLVIKAVATLESVRVTRENKGQNDSLRTDVDSRGLSSPAVEMQSSNVDPTEVDEREKLRRMRISKANKGNTPWNKGRKHSPETLMRIRERTRLAMRDPKVKMKLVNLGHAQTEETRIKIGLGVRLGWERRREKLMLQETCYYEWQNLIAEASRRGLAGEEELQWDSFKILDAELEKEWLQSVEQRKNTPRPKGSKRAPKSAEQRRKISEAISAKWSDPDYRNRVCSGLAKFHGTPEGVERKPRRKPTGDGQPRKRNPPNKKVETYNIVKREPKSEAQRIRPKRSNTPSYKDPLASSKLKMLKNIRAQRAAAENQKIEAITRAKLLIAEAEKAAKALESAAKTSPIAQASLLESRMLIAEAIRSLESIEQGDVSSSGSETNHPPPMPSELVPNVEDETGTDISLANHIDPRKVNGVQNMAASSNTKAANFNLDKFTLPDILHGNVLSQNTPNTELLSSEHLNGTNSCSLHPPQLSNRNQYPGLTPRLVDTTPNGTEVHRKNPPLLNGVKYEHDKAASPQPNGLKFQPKEVEASLKPATVTKKWIRGRLVEVVGEH